MKIFFKGKKNSYENKLDKMYYVRRIESLLMGKNCTTYRVECCLQLFPQISSICFKQTSII